MTILKITPEPYSIEEVEIFEMCKVHFVDLPPYSRTITEQFTETVLQEIREGDVFASFDDSSDLCGLCIVCPPHLDERAGKYHSDYYLAALIVSEDHRKQGVGTALYRHAFLNKSGRVSLITPERNVAAIAFYQKFGMDIIDRFDQSEICPDTREPFNLRRIVMAGDIIA